MRYQHVIPSFPQSTDTNNDDILNYIGRVSSEVVDEIGDGNCVIQNSMLISEMDRNFFANNVSHLIHRITRILDQPNQVYHNDWLKPG